MIVCVGTRCQFAALPKLRDTWKCELRSSVAPLGSVLYLYPGVWGARSSLAESYGLVSQARRRSVSVKQTPKHEV
eukprot:6406977-Prymnesium_polylepis.1